MFLVNSDQLTGSHSNLTKLRDIHGIAMCGYLLQQVSPQHLSVPLVYAVQNLVASVVEEDVSNMLVFLNVS